MTRPTLNERQLQVLDLLSRGLKVDEISERMSLSVHTIRDYLKDIYAALGCNNAAGAVGISMRLGILD